MSRSSFSTRETASPSSLDNPLSSDSYSFRGDNGALLQSSWSDQPQPLPTQMTSSHRLYEGAPGNEGGRTAGDHLSPVYPEFGFGPEGNPTSGLPAETDIVIVVDLVTVYGTPE